MTSTDFVVQEGVPFTRTIRIVDGRDFWSTLDQCEARMQVRKGATKSSPLVYDFTPHLQKSFGTADEANDLIISWQLTGQDTRALRSGFYDLFVSDIGVIDAKAIRPVYGKISKRVAITTAEELPRDC